MPDSPVLLSVAQMRGLSPHVWQSHGIHRVDDRRVPSGIIWSVFRSICIMAGRGEVVGASAGVKAPTRRAMVSQRTPTVRRAALRSIAFSLAKACSIG